jgi:hypothetical protein
METEPIREQVHRRQPRGRRRRHHVHARRRPRAPRGRAGLGKTMLVRTLARRCRSRSRASSSRPTSCRRTSSARRSSTRAGRRQGLRVSQGAHLREHRPRRRDQPRDAEDAERAARGDAGAPRLGRQAHAHARRAVRRPRDAEPARDGGDVPAPEAQLDRFFFKLHVPFPEPRRAPRILDRTTGAPEPRQASSTATRSSRCSARAPGPVARHVQDYAIRVSRRRTPTARRARLAEALRRFGARLAGRRRCSSPPRSARSSTGASPRASTTCARRAPGAAPPRAPQLRGRGRGDQDRPGHRRHPQGAPEAKPEPRERSIGPTRRSEGRSRRRTSTERRPMGLARRPLPWRRQKKASPREDDDLFDDEFQRKLDYLALVSRASSPAHARRAADEEERQRRRVRRPPRLPAGRRLPLPRLERLPALRALLLRLYEEEEDLAIYFIVDASASMGFGDGRSSATRRSVSRRARVRGPRQPRSREHRHDERPRDGAHAETRGKARIFKVFRFLREESSRGTTDLGDAMKTFVAQNKRRGLAVLISDLYDPRASSAASTSSATTSSIRSSSTSSTPPRRGRSSTATCSSTTARRATSARSR